MAIALDTNRRTATKAAIRRASAAARTEMNALDAKALEKLAAVYRQAANDIQDAIRNHAAVDGNLRLDVLRNLLNQANARLGLLEQARNDLFGAELLAAAQLGARPFAGQIGTDLVRVANEAVQFVHSFIAEDGLQISDRIWRVDRHARDVVGQAIESAIIQGHSASRAAQDFLSRGQPVPADIAEKMGLASASRVARVTGDALMTGEGAPYDNALRLFRTELNRAHGEAYRAAAFDHPDVVGTRFLLSPNHPKTDVCDLHASVNRYGLGPGVYPKGKSPWPAHPNTLSYEEVVFADEVTDADRAGKENRIEWLKDQPPGVQAAVLGGYKKRAALEAGVLAENEIATPWRVLKDVYTRRGIDVDSLTTDIAEPASNLPNARAAVGPRSAPGAPVSSALRIEAHRDVAGHALNVIDSVHGDGSLPRIPIRNAPSSAGYFGAYQYTHDDEAVNILVRAGGDHKELTLVHEIGHFLDHQGAPGKGFSSVHSELFAEWRQAVDETSTIQTLRRLRSDPLQVAHRGYLDYLLGYEEIWARSYAQWIARRSRDQTLIRQVADMLARDRQSQVGGFRQWTDDDFPSAARAIENLMRKLGWL